MSARRMSARAIERGFTLIEALVALAIGMAITMALSTEVVRYFDNLAARAIAGHALVAGRAASEYMRDHEDALRAAAGPSTPIVVSAAQLVAGGYTPAGFSAVNQAGQTVELRVIAPTPGELLGIVVGVGGDSLDGQMARRVANEIGAAGGYIDGGGPNTATGAFGGWSADLTAYGGTPGVGRVAIAVFVLDAIEP